jgi:hypothetical protein
MPGPELQRGLARAARVLCCCIGCFVVSAGCKSDAERAHQGQVARIAEHIERLRLADNRDKRAPLEALAAVPCPDAEACALQDLCLRGYRLHQAALDAIAALERQSRSDSPPPADVGQRLAKARNDLAQAKTLTEDCAEQQVRVTRKALMP